MGRMTRARMITGGVRHRWLFSDFGDLERALEGFLCERGRLRRCGCDGGKRERDRKEEGRRMRGGKRAIYSLEEDDQNPLGINKV